MGKKILAVIWQFIGAFAFIFGLIVFVSDLDVKTYLFFAGLCSIACLIYVVYDWIAKHFVLWQNLTLLVLSILLGPLMIWYYMWRATRALRTRTVKYDPDADYGSPYAPRETQSAQTSQPSQTTAMPTVTPKSISQEDADRRQRKSGALDSELNRAVARASLPDGRYSKIVRKDLSVVSKISSIKVYGSITYKIDHIGPERSATEYGQDINEAFERAQHVLANAVQEAVDRVQQNYQGYDNAWSVSINIKPELQQ